MNVGTITVDRETAEAAAAEYRKAVHERHDEEDKMILRGFKEVLKGNPLISLTDAISGGGVNNKGFPKLAVCRAHAKFCWLTFSDNGSVAFAEAPWPQSNARLNVRRFPIGTLKEAVGVWGWRYKAMVPIIPPQLRPTYHLRNYHILWEAEWKKEAPRPPRDPMLLKQIGGDLYSVLATWDLTEVERLVLTQREE